LILSGQIPDELSQLYINFSYISNIIHCIIEKQIESSNEIVKNEVEIDFKSFEFTSPLTIFDSSMKVIGILQNSVLYQEIRYLYLSFFLS
jgi:hypothetical protein